MLPQPEPAPEPKRSTKRQKTSVRLSDDGRHLLRSLTALMGISQTAVLEIAIRNLAKQQGIME